MLGKCAIERSTFTRFYTEENVPFLSRSPFRRDRKILVLAALVSSPLFSYIPASFFSPWIFACTVDTTRDTSLCLWHIGSRGRFVSSLAFFHEILIRLPCSVNRINHDSKNRCSPVRFRPVVLSTLKRSSRGKSAIRHVKR